MASSICCSYSGVEALSPPPSPIASKMPPLTSLPMPKPTKLMKKMNARKPKTTWTTRRRLPLLRSKIIGRGRLEDATGQPASPGETSVPTASSRGRPNRFATAMLPSYSSSSGIMIMIMLMGSPPGAAAETTAMMKIA